jgi:hypothetical protein
MVNALMAAGHGDHHRPFERFGEDGLVETTVIPPTKGGASARSPGSALEDGGRLVVIR